MLFNISPSLLPYKNTKRGKQQKKVDSYQKGAKCKVYDKFMCLLGLFTCLYTLTFFSSSSCYKREQDETLRHAYERMARETENTQ